MSLDVFGMKNLTDILPRLPNLSNVACEHVQMFRYDFATKTKSKLNIVLNPNVCYGNRLHENQISLKN